jgi:endonuclease/exonuclease/phosphatase family metal-dependent hydrolase
MPDQSGVELGVALLSRWPIAHREVIANAVSSSRVGPVLLKATVNHPAGPLPVLVVSLEHATTYSDDRLAQAALLAEAGPELVDQRRSHLLPPGP